MSLLRDYVRNLKASGLLGKGLRQMRRGQHDDARGTLQNAVATLGPRAPRGFLEAGWFSTRMVALLTLSQAAAKLGDVPLARASIQEGLTLWANGGLSHDRGHEGIKQWESWAREYLTWSAKGQAT